MAGAECEGGMAWRREKEVVIPEALPEARGLIAGHRKEFWRLIYKTKIIFNYIEKNGLKLYVSFRGHISVIKIKERI